MSKVQCLKKKEIVDQGGRGGQSLGSYFVQCLGDIDILSKLFIVLMQNCSKIDRKYR